MNLAIQYLPLLEGLAKRQQDPDAAFSAGLITLTKAGRLWDPNGTASFPTYLYRALKNTFIGLTSQHQRLARKLKSVQQLFYTRTGRNLSPENLAALLGISVMQVRQELATDGTVSLEPFSEDDEQGGFEFIDDKALLPDKMSQLDSEYFVNTVDEVLSGLSEIEQQMVKLRFGFFPYQRSYTLKEIGLLLDKGSRHSVCGVLSRILKELRNNKQLKVLVEA